MMFCNFHAKIQFNIIYNYLIKIFKFWLNASYYFLKMRENYASSQNIKDAALKEMAGLRRLKTLNLTATKVIDASVDE